MIGLDAPANGVVLGLAAALGGGLLIGLERERRKRMRPQRAAAGIRSFALAALGGGIAQALAEPALVGLGALTVALLAAIAYWRSLQSSTGEPATDPGLTTELALFITYLVGVLSVQQPALGAGAAAVVAGLLAARERLHRFAVSVLSEAELHDALLLAALTLVLLPLAPAARLPWLGGMAPRTVILLMVLILTLQGVGHVALRALGPRAGLALSGLISGFVSSTATIAAMGARARAEPLRRAGCEAGAIFSTTATWLQAMVMLTALAPAAAAALLPCAALGAAVALAGGVLRLRPLAQQDGAATDAAANAALRGTRGPLHLPEALLVALLLAVVATAAAWAQQRFGQSGLLASAALAALADAHSAVAALGAMQASGQIDALTVRHGALLAVAANSLTRIVTAFAAGGAGFGTRISLSLAASTGAAVALGWWLG